MIVKHEKRNIPSASSELIIGGILGLIQAAFLIFAAKPLVLNFMGVESLAKDLEQNLPNLATQPYILRKSCDGIIGAFSNLKELLSHGHIIFGDSHELRQTDNIGAGIQEWLIGGNMKGVSGQQESGLELVISGRNVESFARLPGGIGLEIIQPVDVDASDSSRASSSRSK
ncbi:WRKY transcription factor 55-like [Forsythia ovata]|uniref:WRKY transcription factor 55-like n=1 Tax=Forsythia ovata TaxID=205694 RepID=A0ABD1QC26_9LAMI